MPPLITTMYVLLFKCYGDIQQMEESKIKSNTELIKKAHEKEEIRVIVKYKKKDKLLSYKELQIKDNLIQKEEVVEKHGGTVVKHLPIIDSSVVFIKSKDIEKLKEDIDVEYIEIDQLVYPLEVISPENITSFSEIVTWAVERVNALEYHQITKGNGIKIAIIDSGANVNHPDLINNIKTGYNFIDNNYDVSDDCDHGTCVSGVIAAESNDFGMLGIAPQSFIYPLKVMHKISGNRCSGYSSDIVQAIEWSIENNMDIINLSLGSPSQLYSVGIALDAAYDAGILIVAAAGNDGTKSTCDDDDCVHYPAKYDSAIAVAAMTWTDTIASYSSRGPEVELTAPGTSVYTTASNGEYRWFSGTSCAAPIISGVAALLMAKYPEKTNVEIREKLIEICTDLCEVGRDVSSGYGIPVLSLEEESRVIEVVIESPHPYPDNYDNTWSFEKPDAKTMSVHFVDICTEKYFDYIYLYDKNNQEIAKYEGTHNDLWSQQINGNIVKIRLTSDGSITKYGFKIDKIKVTFDEEPPCVPNWQCRLPLDGYETDTNNCGQPDRYNIDCEPEPPCVPNWQCRLPLDGYETDINNCGQPDRYNVDCEPETGIIAESPHPYPPSYRNTWVIEQPGASQIRLHFSEIEIAIVDTLSVSWDYRRDYPDEGWTQWYFADEVEISLIASYNGGNAFGFVVDQIETIYD